MDDTQYIKKGTCVNTTMAKGHYLFAKLCESVINEVSTTIDAIKKVPGGPQLGRYMHQQLNIPHDADFRPTTDISLGRSGNYSGGRWYIIAGEKGAAGLQYDNSNREYRLIMPRPADIPVGYDFPSSWGNDKGNEQFIDITTTSGNGAKALMKKVIGKTIELYTKGAEVRRDVLHKQEKRKQSRYKRPMDVISMENAELFLLKKFKPVFLKTLKQAEAEYRGMMNIMLKNASYSKMEEKLRFLQHLDKSITKLETGKLSDQEILDTFGRPMKQALLIAAQHYYPEISGGVQRHWGNYQLSDKAGLEKLIDDIKNGDSKKLSGVLTYFKNSVLAPKK